MSQHSHAFTVTRRPIPHRMPRFSRRFRQGVDARLNGEPRNPKNGAHWLAGWDEGDALVNRAAQRAGSEGSSPSDTGRPGTSGARDYERNGSGVVAFFVTFAAVFAACFPICMLTNAALGMPEPFADDLPAVAIIGALAGLVVGLRQAEIASYPKGNAAGKHLWWQ